MKSLKSILYTVLLNALAICISAQTKEKPASSTDAVSSRPVSLEKALPTKDPVVVKDQISTPGVEPELIKPTGILAYSKNPFEPESAKKIPIANPYARQKDDDENHKGELYIGFSGAIAIDDELGFEPGLNASGVYYFHRFIGIKADFSATFQDISGGKHSLYNITGGVQFKDSSKEKKIKPFAHVLVGFARHKDTRDNFPQFDFESDGLSTIFGGGVDIKVTDNIDIRAFQFDVNPIFSEDVTGFDRTYLNFRYGAGIVFNF